MPTYEFQCRTCGSRTERFLPITSPQADGEPLAESCPDCADAGPLDRVISAATINAEQVKAGQKYPYVSNQHTHAELAGSDRGPLGKAVIRSASHEREVAARNQMRRE